MSKQDLDIAKIDVYTDKEQRQVQTFTPLGKDKPTAMRGFAELRLGNGQAVNFEFRFPDNIKTVRRAFVKFDEVCRKEYDEYIKESKRKKAAESKQIILPGAVSPEQMKKLRDKGEG